MGKSLTAKLASARSRIKELETENKKLNDDRRLYREEFIRLLKRSLELQGQGHTSFELVSFITSMAKLLTRVQSWYWS